MEGRDSPGPFSESFCVPVAIDGLGGLLTLGRTYRTWAREAGSTIAPSGVRWEGHNAQGGPIGSWGWEAWSAHS